MERVMNMILRRLVNKGVDVAAKRASKGGETTPDARVQKQTAQKTSRNAREALRLLRRISRF